MDGWVVGMGGTGGWMCWSHALFRAHIISEHRIHPYTYTNSGRTPIYLSVCLSVYLRLPGATRKKRCRIAVARYLPLAKLPPPALRMSGRSASQLTPRYGLHCRRRPRALELQTRLEPHAWVLGAAGPAAQAEAGAFASASRWALSGTAAPLE